MVARKLLRAEFAADPSSQERFRRESRVAARPAEDVGDCPVPQRTGGDALQIQPQASEPTMSVICPPNGPRRSSGPSTNATERFALMRWHWSTGSEYPSSYVMRRCVTPGVGGVGALAGHDGGLDIRGRRWRYGLRHSKLDKAVPARSVLPAGPAA